MRIKVYLPEVKPDVIEMPEECPHCGGHYFKDHGQKGNEKGIRDLQYAQVNSKRIRCMKCDRTMRVYPVGVSQAQQSDHLKGMSVLLYVLGLSYGGVSDFLGAIGVLIGKSSVYRNVQEAGLQSRRRQQEECEQGQQRAVIGSDGTYIKVKGVKVGIQVVVDDGNQDLLGLELTTSENSAEAVKMVQKIAQKVGAEVLVSDDLGSYKDVADDLGLDHQICRKHVKDNVDKLADALFEQLKKNEVVPDGVDATGAILSMDLALLQWLIRVRPDTAPEHLKQLYHRYKAALKPPARRKHSVWYRMRMVVTRLWERWDRLTLDQRRNDLDGTNNSSERVIGWWIKERYRTMRGYKRDASVKNVVTLTARMGARSGNYDMTELYTA